MKRRLEMIASLTTLERIKFEQDFSVEDDKINWLLQRIREQYQLEKLDREMKLPTRMLSLTEVYAKNRFKVIVWSRALNSSSTEMFIDLEYEGNWIGQKNFSFYGSTMCICPLKSPLFMQDIGSHIGSFMANKDWVSLLKKLHYYEFMMLLQRLGFRLCHYNVIDNIVVRANFWFSV